MKSLQKLNPKHIRAMQLMLTGEFKDHEIAKQLEVRADTLATWKMSPVWQRRFELEKAVWEEDFKDIHLASVKRRMVVAQDEHDRLGELKGYDNPAQLAAVYRQRGVIRDEVRNEMSRLEAKTFNGHLSDAEQARALADWMKETKEQLGISLIDELVAAIEETLK